MFSGDVLSGNIERETGEEVGSYSIVQGSLNNPNYIIDFISAPFAITPKSVTVTADHQTKVYGEIDRDLTFSVVPELNSGDVFSGELSRISGEDVGVYSINQGTLNNSNYAITFIEASLTITAKPIIITAVAQTKTYGESDPNLEYITTPSLIFGDILGGSLQRSLGENVGTYEITSTFVHPNYAISFTSASFTITPKPITITIAEKSKVYGEVDPVLEYTISPELIPDDVLTGIVSRSVGEDVGSYPITSTMNNTNYAITVFTADFTITPKPITVSAVVQQKVYGETDLDFEYIVSPDLVSGDVLTGTLVRDFGEDVGTYQINQGSLDNSNYEITYISALLTIIKGDPITITADNQTKEFDEMDPIFTYRITNGELVLGDELEGSLDREFGENIGDYTITQGTLDNSNYNIIYVPAILTITIPATFDAETTNIFTPDGDGLNDYFKINNLARFYPNFRIIIYDKNSTKLFSYKHNGNPDDEANWWDGTFNGRMLETGVYYFSIDYNNGAKTPKSTWLYLKRE